MDNATEVHLVAGRNPASRWWQNHNPNILVIERESARADKDDRETRQPLMLADVLRRA